MHAERTFDPELRSRRREQLLEMAFVAEGLLGRRPRYDLFVSGSLSRGQVHPWSDLDIILRLKEGRRTSPKDAELSHLIRDTIGYEDVDVIFERDVSPPLVRGLLGSLVRPSASPRLVPLPDPALAISRTAISMRFACESARERLQEIDQTSEERLERYSSANLGAVLYGGAMRVLFGRAPLWMKKLAVFQDGGRSGWLDDHADADELDALLGRLSAAGILDVEGASAMRYLLLDAYGFMYHDEVKTSYRDDFISVLEAVERASSLLAALAPGVEPHGLSTPGAG